MQRRAYLGLLGAGVLAGCSGGDNESGDTSTDTIATSTETPGNDDSDEDDPVADPSTVAFDKRWEERIENHGRVRSTNLGADATADGVFLGADWGIAGLDMADGSRMWKNDEWSGFIDIHGDSDGVFAYTQSFEVVSFDPSEGSERWRAETSGYGRANRNTALTSSYFVAESPDDTVVLYERGSGDTALELDESPDKLLATDDFLVVITSTETTVFDIPSGNERWTTDPFIPGAVIGDGRLIGYGFFDQGYLLKAVDLASGEERWSKDLGNVAFDVGSFVTEDGVVMFLTMPIDQTATVHGYDLKDGSQLWTQDIGDLENPLDPVTANGVVITTGSIDGQKQLLAYNVQNGEQLDTTEVEQGFSAVDIVDGVAVDRTFVGVDLAAATVYEF